MIVSNRKMLSLQGSAFAFHLLVCVVIVSLDRTIAVAQPSPATLSSPDRITHRYWEILERNPRPGTAFDQWYRGYVDRGEVAALTAELQSRAERNTRDANSQLLLGLVLRRQGDLESAVKVLKRATDAAPDSYYPQFLLGQLLQQSRQFRESANSLAKAVKLARNSHVARLELLSLYRDLGRSQQLAGNADAAVTTWNELGELFPDDERVHSQIASWMQNDNRWNEALAAWKRVEELATDPYAKITTRLAISDVYRELKDHSTAVAILDRALDDAKPGSGLEKDIRSRLESIHQKDANGWIEFLHLRLERHPDELGSIVQLSSAFNGSRRFDESIALLVSALERAPKQRHVRVALVATLREAQEFEQAYQQNDILLQQHPRDVEYLRLAGQLRIEAASSPTPEAVVTEVLNLWRRIPATRPDDANLIIQTADLCARAGGVSSSLTKSLSPAALKERFTDNAFVAAAERFYRAAIQEGTNGAATKRSVRSPTVYYEYLAQFLRDIGRPAEAVDVLKQMVTGKGGGEQWYQVARIFRRLGYPKEALSAAENAVERSPENATYREFCVTLCRSQEKYDEAISHLDFAISQLEKPRDIANMLQLRVEILGEGRRLPIEQRRILKRINGSQNWQDFWQLGLIYSAQNQPQRAQPLLHRALEALPDETVLLTASAELDVVLGDLDAGIRKYERLAKLEPHLRASHFRRVVELYIGQNNHSLARQAADRLFATPAIRGTDYLERAVVAKMVDEIALEARLLQRAVQIEPRNVEARLALGKALAERNDNAGALENYWRAFELANSLKEKGTLLRTMHGLDENLFHRRIVTRLENRDASGLGGHESRMSLADAYVASGNLAKATDILQDCLRADALDPGALKRIAEIELKNDRPAIAAEYLERLARVSDSVEVWQQLLRAYEQVDRTDACVRVAARLLRDFGHSAIFVELTDRVPLDQPSRALAFARAGIALRPNDWRLRIRMALILNDNKQRLAALEAALQSCLADPGLIASAETQAEATTSLASAKPPRNTTASFLRQSQVSMVLNSHYFPVFQEFNNARSNANRYIRQQQLIQAHRQMPKASDASLTAPRSVIGKGNLIPNDPYNAAVYCHQVLAKEYGKKKASRLFQKEVDEGESWIRRRIEIVSLAASEELWSNLDRLETYARLRPDDLLPHVAKFYESIPSSVLEEQAAANLQSLNASFAWLESHHPNLASNLSGQYAQQLVSVRQFENAGKLLATKINSAQSLRTLVELAPTCMKVDSPAFRENFLTRALELSTAPDSIPEDLGDVLLVAFNDPLRHFKATEWVAVLALLEKHLKKPLQSNRSRTVTSIRTYQSTQTSHQQLLLQLSNVLTDPTLSSSQKKAIVQAAQRQKLQAARQRGKQSRLGGRSRVSTDKIMNANNPHLSPYQREVLSRAIDQAQISGDERMIMNWLSQKASMPTASITQKMAYPFALWAANQRETAADQFAQLSREFPQDVNLRLLAATAAFEVNKLDASFVMLSDKSLRGSRVESDTILLQSQINSSLATLTDYDIGLRCLVAAMEHQTVPYLYPFFARQNRYTDVTTTLPEQQNPRSGETLTSQAETNQWSPKDQWLLSGNPVSSTVILGILDHAWQLDHGFHAEQTNARTGEVAGNLQRLQKLVETNLTLHSNNQELIGLQILLRLRNREFDAAKARISDLRNSNTPEQWTSPTIAELASVMSRLPQTSELGYEMACRYIIGNIAAGATQRGTELLKDITYSISDTRRLGDRDVGQRFWETYFFTLEEHSSAQPLVDREETVVESIKAIYEAAHDTIPSALANIAKSNRGPLGTHLQPNVLGPVLFSTIRNANLHWLNSERASALDALLELTFPKGLHGEAAMWNWYQFPDSESDLHRYSLAEWIIGFAATTHRLDEIRQQLETHPDQNDAQILALRLEIAKLDNDLTKLIPLAAQTKKRDDIDNPPVWSPDLVAQLDPDLQALGYILRRSGAATLKIGNQSVRVRSLELPTIAFSITEVSFTFPDVKRVRSDATTDDSGRRDVRSVNAAVFFDPTNLNLAKLKWLKAIELTNVPLRDKDVAIFDGCRRLTSLALDGTQITDLGLRKLVDIESLRKLSVTRTKVSEVGLSLFRESRPNCQLISTVGSNQ